MKRILLSVAVVIAAGAFLFLAVGASNNSAAGTYKILFDNGFGLVNGADFKVAGVPAGSIKKIELPPGCINGDSTQCRALVTVQVTQSGFGSFHQDAFCQSRPQSLIGEYFVECEPGRSGPVLKPGSTIPVTRTQSTIPGDLLQNVMRMPYRERFTLIINELGAAAAGRSGDLQAALQRAVPALSETDNLLKLLGDNSSTLQSLTANSNSVITALANNGRNVQRFIDEANRISVLTAQKQAALQQTFQQLPAFLQELRPAMANLSSAADTNIPVLQNLNEAATQAPPGGLARFFHDITPFSRASLPALRSLGHASVTGKSALIAAKPTITDLNQFAQPTPELAQNLAIVLHDLDDRNRAVERDSRSPQGRGFTGLEALLQYAFIQPLSINGFGRFSHYLAVDAFTDPRCSPYATQQSVANGLAASGPSYRECYAWLGPNQPGINETDPSNPHGCVPDPGGAPPGFRGPRTSACKMAPNPVSALSPDTRSATRARTAKAASSPGSSARTATAAASRSSGAGGSTGSGSGSGSGSGGSSGNSTSAQTQQLLNYLLAP